VQCRRALDRDAARQQGFDHVNSTAARREAQRMATHAPGRTRSAIEQQLRGLGLRELERGDERPSTGIRLDQRDLQVRSAPYQLLDLFQIPPQPFHRWGETARVATGHAKAAPLAIRRAIGM
jgi:hypothetical protein